VYQQRTRLDIEELWKHLMKVSKRRYQRKKKKNNMPVQLTKASRDVAQQQVKYGILEGCRQQQGNNKTTRQVRQQHKVWDPGGLQQMKTHDQRS
jgi:hypothetical protein